MTGIDVDTLVAAYTAVAVPLDQLPYAPEMTELLDLYSGRAGARMSERECWRRLVNLRKRGQLPRIGRR